jgi:hypothetical protein
MENSLVPLYSDMAADGHSFRGFSILQHAKAIRTHFVFAKVKTVLDYGCGRGDQYRSEHRLFKAWGIRWCDMYLYDPAFPQYATLPDRRFDAVICSDVLEHIPEDEVDRFIADLFNHAKKLVWASVCCRPAKKSFPGTEINLHVTLRPLEWWDAKFKEIATLFPAELKIKYVLAESV